MISYRIKYKNIISELYLPQKHNGQTIIFLAGLPSFLGKNELTKKMTESGCVVFQPFYSGSFDSSGSFTPRQCLKDVKNFIEMARQKKFVELYYNKILKINTKRINLVGISFGASIAMLAAKINPLIKKIVLISPVLTYRQNDYDELGFEDFKFGKQMNALLNLLKQAYPYTYRFTDHNQWHKFLLGESPLNVLSHNNKIKTLILHGKNDASIPEQIIKKIYESKLDKNLVKLIIDPQAGHSLFGFNNRSWRVLIKFINED